VTVTVRELAELVRGRLHGDGDILISGARSLGEAGAGHITFVENDRQARHLVTCRASAFVVPLDLPANGLTVIRVADPLSAFLTIVERLRRDTRASATAGAVPGEGEVPPLPRYPELEGEGFIETSAYIRDCNYFNNLESNTDELHVSFVHRDSAFTDEGLNRDLPEVSGEETSYGFVKYGKRSDGIVRVSHFFMPNMLYIASSPDAGSGWTDHIAWRVPVDDATHRSFQSVLVHLTGEAAEEYKAKKAANAARLRELEPAREVARKLLAGEITWADVGARPDIVNIQDNVAQAGQGVIADHEHERLGRSDVVLIMFRQMWRRELQALAEGSELKQWTRAERVAATSGV